MRYEFVYDARLGIRLPQLEQDWEAYTSEERSDMLFRWEQIRGTIPEQIIKLEQIIIAKQNQLNIEDDFRTSCLLNWEIAETASTINDLHLWFRVNQDLETKVHQ